MRLNDMSLSDNVPAICPHGRHSLIIIPLAVINSMSEGVSKPQRFVHSNPLKAQESQEVIMSREVCTRGNKYWKTAHTIPIKTEH